MQCVFQKTWSISISLLAASNLWRTYYKCFLLFQKSYTYIENGYSMHVGLIVCRRTYPSKAVLFYFSNLVQGINFTKKMTECAYKEI